MSALSEDQATGMVILNNFLKENRVFDKQLQDAQNLRSHERSWRKTAASVLATNIDFILHNDVGVALKNNTLQQELATLSFRKNRNNEELGCIIVNVSSKSDFGQTYFAILRELVIARSLSSKLKTKELNRSISFNAFYIMYNEFYSEAVNLVTNDINGYLKRWITSEELKVDFKYWNDEQKKVKEHINSKKSIFPQTKNRADYFYQSFSFSEGK